jgi:hypothetical protein
MLLNPLQQMRLARLLRQKAQHASLSDGRRLRNHAAVFEALATSAGGQSALGADKTLACYESPRAGWCHKLTAAARGAIRRPRLGLQAHLGLGRPVRRITSGRPRRYPLMRGIREIRFIDANPIV